MAVKDPRISNTEVESLTEKIFRYKEMWEEYVWRMTQERIPKQDMNYKLRGRGNMGRPWMRWWILTSLNLEEKKEEEEEETNKPIDKIQFYLRCYIATHTHRKVLGKEGKEDQARQLDEPENILHYVDVSRNVSMRIFLHRKHNVRISNN